MTDHPQSSERESAAAANAHARCVDCGAELEGDGPRCVGCVLAEMGIESVAARRSQHAMPQAGSTFSLSTLLLVTTLFAIVLGAWSITPGLSVVLLAWFAPALVRTAHVVRAWKRQGRRTTGGDKLQLFAISLAVILIAALAGFSCLVVTCGPIVAWVDNGHATDFRIFLGIASLFVFPLLSLFAFAFTIYLFRPSVTEGPQAGARIGEPNGELAAATQGASEPADPFAPTPREPAPAERSGAEGGS